jgi:hypothetical protein
MENPDPEEARLSGDEIGTVELCSFARMMFPAD